MPGPTSDTYAPPRDNPPFPPVSIDVAKTVLAGVEHSQIVIIVRCDMTGDEAVTTYGEGDDNSRVAMLMGNYIKTQIMSWPSRHAEVAKTQWALRKVLAPERYST